MKILIVEDNHDIVDIVNFILNDDGHEVIICTDGSSIDRLQQIKPDLILMDEKLPNNRGSVLCSTIKQSPLHYVPVILISAVTALPQIAATCYADAYIEKPFDINVLSATVRQFLAASRQSID